MQKMSPRTLQAVMQSGDGHVDAGDGISEKVWLDGMRLASCPTSGLASKSYGRRSLEAFMAERVTDVGCRLYRMYAAGRLGRCAEVIAQSTAVAWGLKAATSVRR